MNHRLSLIACIITFWLTSAEAAVVTIEGTITSIDAARRSIIVDADGEQKMLDVSRKVKVSVSGKTAGLDTLSSGQQVKLSYHDDLEIVLKIDVVGTVTQGQDTAIDVLERLDVESDSVVGDWRLHDGVLISPRVEGATLELPVDVPSEYDLIVRVRRRVGDDTFAVGLVLEGHQFIASIDSLTKAGRGSGIERIDDLLLFRNGTMKRGGLLKDGRAVEIKCEVRRGSVSVTADGRQLVSWRGNADRLSLQRAWVVRNASALFLGSWDTEHRIDRIELRPTTDTSGDSANWLVGEWEIEWTEQNGNTGTFVYTFSEENEVFRDGSLLGRWEEKDDQVRVQYASSKRGHVVVTRKGKDQLAGKQNWRSGRKSTWKGRRLRP